MVKKFVSKRSQEKTYWYWLMLGNYSSRLEIRIMMQQSIWREMSDIPVSILITMDQQNSSFYPTIL